MSAEVFWISLTVLFTALLWIPYVLNSFYVVGILETMGVGENRPPLSPWAQRAQKGHNNAIENLVLFLPTAILYTQLKGATPGTILLALQVYFFARVLHFLFITFKIPYLRTVAFLVGWGATLFILVKIMTTSSV